ncbi:MAG: NAD(P)/FAD-dependent oxidoreductase [Thermoleophilia bacterium]|nr:NAD(P)/FAD-dependent oxidoreductase [Thermoleophilia bacterium]
MVSNGRPVVVLGAGSSGEHFVGALRRLDPEVEIVVVEREFAGGLAAPAREPYPLPSDVNRS